MKFLACFGFGGTERQAANLVRSLDSSRFELHTGCLKSVGPFASDFRERALTLEEYRISRLYDHTALKQVLRLATYIRSHRIDIVHSYGFYSNVFAIPAARLGGAPVVLASIRDTGDVWTPWQNRAQKTICRFADHVLVNADAVRQRLVSDGYDQRRISVIGNGVVNAPSEAAPHTPLRAEFGLSPQARLVAVLAVLRPLKGIEYFLEAAQILSTRFGDVRFLVVGDSVLPREGNQEPVGDPAYRQQLERHAHSLGLDGRVVFTGLRRDAADVLSQVAVSVLPSLSEGLSNVLLESMAAGIPVVATRVGGNAEAVDDGVTGVLVPPRDPVRLADAISLLLADPELAARMGCAGRRRVAERFSVHAMVRSTEQLYVDLLARTRRRVRRPLPVEGVVA